MKKLSSYKNIHLNSDIYVIGSGKSLDFLDKSFFDNKITIGVNQSYQYIQPMYLVRKEHKFIDLVLKNTNDNVIHFISSGDCGNGNKNIITKYKDNKRIIFFNHTLNCKQLNGQCKSLPLDDESLVVSNSTITSAIHLAAIMGAKNIILAGHDGGSINNQSNFTNYHTTDTMQQKNEKLYKDWLTIISSDTIILKKLLKEKYNCNILSLNPFINFNLEGNKFTK